jgi:hypothetical protein
MMGESHSDNAPKPTLSGAAHTNLLPMVIKNIGWSELANE